VAVFAAVFLPLPLPAERFVELDELFAEEFFAFELFAVDRPDDVFEAVADDRPVDELPAFALVLRLPVDDLAPDDFEPVERPFDDFELDERPPDEDFAPDDLPPDAVFDFDEPDEPEDLLLEREAELPELLPDELLVFFPPELLFFLAADELPEELLVFFPPELLLDPFADELPAFLPDELFFAEELFVEDPEDLLRDVPLPVDPVVVACSAADAAAPNTAPPAAPASISVITSLALS